MVKNPNSLSIGTIVGFHGVKGEVKVNCALSNLDVFLQLDLLDIQLSDGNEISKSIKDIRSLDKDQKNQRGQLGIIFEDLHDRTSAEFLLGATIHVIRQKLAPLKDDEWWISDLIDMRVYTTDGKLVGTISSIIDGPTSTLEILPNAELGKKRILVPFVKSLVPCVNLAARKIEVVNLPGLLEPQ